MARRIENGDIGGGKRGKYESKSGFVARDQEMFSMKYFNKPDLKEGERRRNRKKRKRRERRRRNCYDGSSDE